MANSDRLAAEGEGEEDCKPLILNVLNVAKLLADQGLEPWPGIQRRGLTADYRYPQMIFYIEGVTPLPIDEAILLQFATTREATITILHQIEKLWKHRMGIAA